MPALVSHTNMSRLAAIGELLGDSDFYCDVIELRDEDGDVVGYLDQNGDFSPVRVDES